MLICSDTRRLSLLTLGSADRFDGAFNVHRPVDWHENPAAARANMLQSDHMVLPAARFTDLDMPLDFDFLVAEFTKIGVHFPHNTYPPVPPAAYQPVSSRVFVQLPEDFQSPQKTDTSTRAINMPVLNF